jgi:hypothetical protein
MYKTVLKNSGSVLFEHYACLCPWCQEFVSKLNTVVNTKIFLQNNL